MAVFLAPLTRASALVLASLALVACGSETDSTATDRPDDSPSPSGPACVYAEAEPAAKQVEPPPDHAAVTGTVPVTLATTVGDLELDLDAERAPCTVNSFVSLAEQGYFDATSCHRLTTAGIFVLQCGDPTATGTGGPGYTIEDEVDGTETYPAGTLAMARTSAPDSGGSQFFVVYDDTRLPPQYTVFGTVSDDTVALVEKVAADGVDDAFGPGDGHPVTAVVIEQATVEE